MCANIQSDRCNLQMPKYTLRIMKLSKGPGGRGSLLLILKFSQDFKEASSPFARSRVLGAIRHRIRSC